MALSKQEAIIAAKLLVEDQATAALNHIKKGFDDVDKAQQHTQKGMGMFKSVLSTFAAVNLMPAIHQVYNFGKTIIEAATQVQQADRAITALQMANQRTGWNETIGKTKELRKELDNIALASGEARVEIDHAFQSYLTMEGASEKNVAGSIKMMGEFANIATRTGLDINRVSTEFAMMEEGVFRARGAIFQLLHTTGIFGDKVHGAATQWSKLTQESRHDKLIWAIERINKSLEETPKTAGQLFGILSNLATIRMQHFGEGFFTGIKPAFQSLINTLLHARGELDDKAEILGQHIGELFGKVLYFVEDKVNYIQEHWNEIAKSIIGAWAYAKSVVEFIIDHKEALAATYVGAKLATSTLGQAAVVGTGTAIAKGAAFVADAGVTSTAAYLAMRFALALPAIATVGTIIAGITGIAGIFGAVQYLKDGLKERVDDDVKAIKQYFEKIRESGAAISESQRTTIANAYNNLKDRAESGNASAKAAMELAGNIKNQSDIAAENRKNLKEELDSYVAYNAFPTRDVIADASKGITDSLGTPDSTLEIAKNFLNRPELEKSFVALNDMTIDQMVKFVAILKTGGDAFGTFADDMQKKIEALRKGMHPPSGGDIKIGTAHFNIKQDFRDADPDRIAIAFQRDIRRGIENRLQSSMSHPY